MTRPRRTHYKRRVPREPNPDKWLILFVLTALVITCLNY